MKEFVHNHQDHVDEAFDRFKSTHKKTYAHELEQLERKKHFKHNLR